MLLEQRCAGPNGSAVTNANATSPQQFDAVAVSGTGTTVTYSNSKTIHDNPTSIDIHMAAVSSTAAMTWSTAFGGSSYANIYMRFYAYFTAIPSAQFRLAGFLQGAQAASSGIAFTTTGKIRTLSNLAATIATSTASIPLNTWVRIEYDCLGISGTTGTLNARFYSGANLEDFTADANSSISTAGAGVGGLVNGARPGGLTATAMSSAWDAWYSDIAVSDSPIGPLPFRGWGIKL